MRGRVYLPRRKRTIRPETDGTGIRFPGKTSSGERTTEIKERGPLSNSFSFESFNQGITEGWQFFVRQFGLASDAKRTENLCTLGRRMLEELLQFGDHGLTQFDRVDRRSRSGLRFGLRRRSWCSYWRKVSCAHRFDRCSFWLRRRSGGRNRSLHGFHAQGLFDDFSKRLECFGVFLDGIF
uniref:Uncharacterized protein n=1 Tax=Podoviridae sp. ctlMy11 TaxID=2827746 RepID=A0A8S5TCF2_9CAUD|nr:MAG TPA: hypothetical protein [Podoviridae sp. ctlMy11]